MIKLKEIMNEVSEPFEDEIDDLEGKDAIVQFLIAQGKEPQVIQLGKDEYVIYDDKIIDPSFPQVQAKEEWLYDHSARRLRETLKDMIEERFNKNFWERPEVLYHGTPIENVETIDREGLKMQHKSRGLSNRSITRAVFTTQSPEYAEYHYGPAVFEINTPQMKADGFMPQVVKEPNHTESDVLNFLAQKIGAWEEERDLAQANSEGTTDDTVIIYADIPPKYLKLL